MVRDVDIGLHVRSVHPLLVALTCHDGFCAVMVVTWSPVSNTKASLTCTCYPMCTYLNVYLTTFSFSSLYPLPPYIASFPQFYLIVSLSIYISISSPILGISLSFSLSFSLSPYLSLSLSHSLSLSLSFSLSLSHFLSLSISLSLSLSIIFSLSLSRFHSSVYSVLLLLLGPSSVKLSGLFCANRSCM